MDAASRSYPISGTPLMKVMIVVTHLLGTGHLTRAVTLAQAFKQAGHTPIVVSGGLPVPRLASSGVTILQLPPVRSDGVDFSKLLDTSGALVDPAYLHERQVQLVDILKEYEADAIITELFPFGRRILKDEFILLLKAAESMTHRPAVFASIRDILAPPSKPAKAVFADNTIAEFYDAVLVHSDPQIMPLDLSWPVSDALKGKLHYTGFVSPPPSEQHPGRLGEGEIIISAGGGDVGRDLFNCARTAAALDNTRQWRILVGGQNAVTIITELKRDAPANLIVEPTRSDFRQMLHHAAVSVSFCGYNTALDLLQTTCPAVLVPFDAGGEVEQGIRAQSLAQQSGFEVLRAAELSPQALLNAIEAAINDNLTDRLVSQSNGAVRTVEIVTRIKSERHAG